MNICIPTYPPHFECVENFLNSYNKFNPNSNIPINIMVTEGHEFYFSKFKNNVNITTLKSLIKEIDNIDINENDLLNSTNKFSFQSIKKYYLSLKYEDSLIIDSENECVNSFNDNILIEFVKQNQNKIYYSHEGMDIHHKIDEDCHVLLNKPLNFDKWLFVTSFWVMKQSILKELKEYLEKTHNKKIYQLFLNKTIFEYVLYAWWCSYNNYGINFINTDLLIDESLIKNVETWATTEHIARGVNNTNINLYCNYLNTQNILISRIHWLSEENKKYVILNTNTKIGTLHK